MNIKTGKHVLFLTISFHLQLTSTLLNTFPSVCQFLISFSQTLERFIQNLQVHRSDLHSEDAHLLPWNDHIIFSTVFIHTLYEKCYVTQCDTKMVYHTGMSHQTGQAQLLTTFHRTDTESQNIRVSKKMRSHAMTERARVMSLTKEMLEMYVTAVFHTIFQFLSSLLVFWQ